MNRTLYIHIGAHRTATTSTQKYLRLNAARLLERGFFLPFGVSRHFDLFNRLFDGRLTVSEAAKDIAQRADNKTAPVHSIILSDEDVCTRRNLERLQPFRDHFDVKVVFSMRRQDLWIESWYQQNVKWQWNPELSHLRFADFLDRRPDFFWIDYDGMIDRLERLFGAGNVLPLVFEKGQMPDGPVTAFCDAIGLTDRDGFAEAPHTNVSLSPMMTEFMRTLPLDEMPGPVRRVFERACARADKDLAFENRSTLFLDHEERQALLDEFEPGNRAVARRLFDRDRLFLEPLPAPDATLAVQFLPVDSYDTQTQLVAPFVRALALGIKEIEPPRDTSVAGPAKPGKPVPADRKKPSRTASGSGPAG